MQTKYTIRIAMYVCNYDTTDHQSIRTHDTLPDMIQSACFPPFTYSYVAIYRRHSYMIQVLGINSIANNLNCDYQVQVVLN